MVLLSTIAMPGIDMEACMKFDELFDKQEIVATPGNCVSRVAINVQLLIDLRFSSNLKSSKKESYPQRYLISIFMVYTVLALLRPVLKGANPEKS